MICSRGQNAPCTRLATVAILASVAIGLPTGVAMAKEPKSDEEKTVYFLGVITSRNARELDLSTAEQEMMMQGWKDALEGKELKLDHAEYLPKLQELAKERREAVLIKEQAKSEDFLAQAAKSKGAKVTESGLIYSVVKKSNGDQPGPTDTVRVHYHGTLRDGTVFDSSLSRDPAEFPLNRVIPCWTEGVGMMKVGSKAKIICPPEIAYGDRGAPPSIPGGAVLTFEIELIDIVPAASPTEE